MPVSTPPVRRPVLTGPDTARAGAASVRPIVPAHLDAVVALNNTEVPRVSPLAGPAAHELVAQCDVALAALDPAGELAGFVLALPPGVDYGSVNYRFFADRGTDFLYVDRVVVSAGHRRLGIAGRLYDAVVERARASGRAEVACEVNVRPPNPGSLAFHRARGFVEVGRQDTTGGTLTVALLALPLD